MPFVPLEAHFVLYAAGSQDWDLSHSDPLLSQELFIIGNTNIGNIIGNNRQI